jgi:hypothetical protein
VSLTHDRRSGRLAMPGATESQGQVAKVALAEQTPLHELSRHRSVSDDALAAAPGSGHHESHRSLISPLETVRWEGGGRLLDAIIIPTSRPWRKSSSTIRYAATLARHFGAELVILCSQLAERKTFPKDLVASLGVRVTVESMLTESIEYGLLPDFRTSRHELASNRWTKPRDVADKRNIALVKAKQRHWKTVLFLDDDVYAPPRGDDEAGEPFGKRSLTRALRAVHAGAHDVVGWTMTNFPDNSVVCHARGIAGLPQDRFISGGALLVKIFDGMPFFPRIYNEDWLFLHPYLQRRAQVPVAGPGTIRQRVYEPFTKVRAQSEELGDMLAEGLFGALSDALDDERLHSLDYWIEVVRSRRMMIKDVLGKLVVQADGPSERRRIPKARKAVRAALQVHQSEPTEDVWAMMILGYLDAWREDQEEWSRFFARLGDTVPPSSASADADFIGGDDSAPIILGGSVTRRRVRRLAVAARLMNRVARPRVECGHGPHRVRSVAIPFRFARGRRRIQGTSSG